MGAYLLEIVTTEILYENGDRGRVCTAQELF